MAREIYEPLDRKVARLALDAEAGYDALNKELAGQKRNSEVAFWMGFIERTEAKIATLKSSGLVILNTGWIEILKTQIRNERVDFLKGRRAAKRAAEARREALAGGAA